MSGTPAGVPGWSPTLGERLRGRRLAVRAPGAALAVGAAIVAAFVLVAVLAPVLAPADPARQDLRAILLPPFSDGHPLGTDQLGRDVLSRLLYAARTDILVALAAVVAPLLAGTALGALAGYFGGRLDTAMSIVIDIVFAFPVLVLLIALVFVLEPGVVSIVAAITLVNWVAYARLTRAAVRGQRSLDYVVAARIGGLSHARVLGRHVLPNVMSQNVVYAMSDAVLVILAITTLGYLGLGVPPPAPDWGGMIADAQPYAGQAWWLAVLPGLAIFAAGLGFSLVADGLADRIDR